MSQSTDHPIPDKLNARIALITSLLHMVLLWLGTQTWGTGWFVLIVLLFVLNLIPVYSLIHEAEHQLLHKEKEINYRVGVWLCCLFIAPFSFVKRCHLNHHAHNRSDYEMWDLYYEHQNRWLKHGYLYLFMVGMEWVLLVIGTALFCLLPKLVFSRLFSWNKEISGIIQGTDSKNSMRKIRLESWLVLIMQTALFLALGLHPMAYLIMYLAHGLAWSSQNYVNHAFSPRDIVNGAHNHRLSPFFKYIYLNFNVHKVHHQNPTIPWLHLPRFVPGNESRISYWKTYLRLWKGPELTHEPSPIVHEK